MLDGRDFFTAYKDLRCYVFIIMSVALFKLLLMCHGDKLTDYTDMIVCCVVC